MRAGRGAPVRSPEARRSCAMPQVPSRPPAATSVSASSGPWSPQAVELLTSLWTSGDHSASQIAHRLGVTRNAVLGKVHRLGLSSQRPAPVRVSRQPAMASLRAPRRAASGAAKPRRSPQRLLPGPSPTAGLRPSSPDAVPEAPLPTADDVAQVAHWEDLGPGRCCWPCGDPKDRDFGFCGAAAPDGPYCESHAQRAFRPGGRASVADLLRLAARAGA